MDQCILKEMGIDNKLWEEAVNTTMYILDHFPTKAIQDCTPYDAWFGKKPSIYHLRIFGSTQYVHIPKNNRKKLDEKSIKYVFVGYSNESKSYRCYDLIFCKLHINWDVIFN